MGCIVYNLECRIKLKCSFIWYLSNYQASIINPLVLGKLYFSLRNKFWGKFLVLSKTLSAEKLVHWFWAVSEQKTMNKKWGNQKAGRGWRTIEGNACRQTLGFWKPPTWPVMPECAHWLLMLSTAVINWPITCLASIERKWTFEDMCGTKTKYLNLSKYFERKARMVEIEKS